MEKKKVILGLDLGIASVGWCITDLSKKEKNEYPIILHGVRLFDSVDDPKDSKLLNETKREKRSLRRRNRREFTRKRDFIKFLIDEKAIELDFDRNPKILVDSFVKKYINPFYKNIEKKYKDTTNLAIGFHNMRKAAIEGTKKLDKNEQIVLLYFYLSLRGAFFENPEETKSKEIPKEVEEFWASSHEKGKALLPIDILVEYFKKFGKLRSSVNLKFSNQDYLKELEKIFQNQNIEFIDFNKFAKDERSFFSRIRNYSEGPGNEKTFSKYGLYADEKGKSHFILKEGVKIYQKQFNTLWEKTIGKCSYDNNLFRAPKKAFSANVFDIVNKLVDWKINNEYLDNKLKEEILLSRFENKTGDSKIKKILEKYNFELTSLSNIAYDGKKNKILLPSIDSYHEILKILEKHLSNYEKFVINEKNIKNLFDFYKEKADDLFKEKNHAIDFEKNLLYFYDNISLILNKFSTSNDRVLNLNKYFKNIKLSEGFKTYNLVSEDISKLSQYNKTTSLSFGAYYKFIPLLIKTEDNKNYSTLSYEEKTLKTIKNSEDSENLFSKNWIEELVASPTVKRTLRQSMNLLKEIFSYSTKNNLEITKIVVEMTRASNNKKAKENISNLQKFRETKYKEIANKHSLENKSSSLLKKLWLLEQQKGYDAYSLKKIDSQNVIKKPYNYDIEHIIPRSLSFDNSFSNIVLVNKEDNAKKSNNQTAYQFLKKEYGNSHLNKAIEKWTEWFLDNSSDRKVFKDKEKLNTLINIKELSEFDNKEFINRNLTDTSYITSALLNHLTFSKSKFEYRVIAVNGKQTTSLRRQIAYKCVRQNGMIWKRPEGFNDLTSQDFEKENSNDIEESVIFKDRSFNGHHAEDAYFITIISEYFRTFKKIEKFNMNYSKKAKDMDSFEKNDLNFQDKSSFSDEFLSNILSELENNLKNIRFSKMVVTRRNSQLFGDTIFSAKLLEDKKTLQPVKKLDLLSLVSKDIKKIEKYFDEEKIDVKKLNSLAIYKHDKKLYEYLKFIWNDSKLEVDQNNLKKEKNYFLYFSKKHRDKYGEHVPIFDINQRHTRNIRNIKYFKSTKKTEEIIFTKENKNDSLDRKNFSFYDSYEWFQIWVYLNEENKYKFISIDARNTFNNTDTNAKNAWKVNETNLKKQKEKLKINLNSKAILKINKNDSFLDENNNLVYVIGREEKSQRIEIKYLLGKKLKLPKQNYKVINKWLPLYKKVDLDYMGNIFIKKEFNK